MFLLIVLLRLFRFFYGTFVKPLVVLYFKFYYRNIDKKNPLPPLKSPLLLLPAHELTKRIRSKKVTCTQVIQAYIDRIKEVDPLINCAVVTCFDTALQEAQVVDNVLALDVLPIEYSEQNKPYLGVPFSCKESVFVKGMPNTSGSLLRKDVLATEDSNGVRYMREAGAILLCLTNVSEFCMWMESRNLHYGISRNPYNLSRIVGGSTGGEGGILSACGSLVGLGGDVAGSIRMPAFFNGVYGHKPSPKMVNNQKQFPRSEGFYRERLSCAGPLCRYASDLRLLLKIQADKDRYAEIADKMATKTNLKNLKYYVITDLGDCLYVSDQDSECKAALNKAVSFLETSLDVKVTRIEIQNLKYAFNMWAALANNGERSLKAFNKLVVASNNNQPFNPFSELFKSAFGLSKYSFNLLPYAIVDLLPKPDPQAFMKMRQDICAELDHILGDNGVLLAPGFPCVAPYHSQPFLTNTIDAAYFFVWNAMDLPVTQCPMGLSQTSGLPLGVQVVGNTNCDHLTISIAEYFEKNLVGWTPGF